MACLVGKNGLRMELLELCHFLSRNRLILYDRGKVNITEHSVKHVLVVKPECFLYSKWQ